MQCRGNRARLIVSAARSADFVIIRMITDRIGLYSGLLVLPSLIVTNKVIFGAIYLTRVVYTKAITHPDVGEIGRYLPPPLRMIVKKFVSPKTVDSSNRFH